VNRRLLILGGLAIAGVVVGLVAEYVDTGPLHPWDSSLTLDLAVGWAYIACGLVAIARRPHNRTGLLMLAVGFSWFIGNFRGAGSPVLVSLGTAFQSLSDAFLAHLVLAYPDGRLTRRSERVVVVSIYAWVIAQALALALTYDPQRFYACRSCLSGPFALFASRTAYDAVTSAGTVAGAVFAVIVLALVVRRFMRSSEFARRDLAPLWVAAGLIAVAYVLEALQGGSFNEGAAGVQNVVDARKAALLLVPLMFLFGLFRSRLAESSVARLVVELGRPLRHGELRALLARALGDPSLELAFSVPGERGFVDEDGVAVKLPRDDPDRATTPVKDGSRTVAALVHDRALRERQPLVDAVGAAARLALENERLQAEVRSQLEEVRASRARIVATADAERRRIERNLHDGAQQRLVTLSLELALAREHAASGASGELQASLDEAAADVAAALAELRELGRGLHPAILTEAGLGAALEALAERAAVTTHVNARLPERPPAPVEAAAYFVAAEALANAAKHARATHVNIEAHKQNGRLMLLVDDDGVGGADSTCGSGLVGLTDRVAALGGNLVIDSPAGRGTHLQAELPCK
jgi:signal transduction histidine kinase